MTAFPPGAAVDTLGKSFTQRSYTTSRDASREQTVAELVDLFAETGTDHLKERNRRLTSMTYEDGSIALVYDARGNVITGAATLDARFPGQWFQLESGLHYNWHRHYDPTIGRYTQPDPLGFVDGPSVFGHAVGSPAMAVDPEGRATAAIPALPSLVLLCAANPLACGALAVGSAAIGIMCMAGDRKQNIENEYSREARNHPDPCSYLRDLYNNTSDSRERQKIKTAQKALGCRRTGRD